MIKKELQGVLKFHRVIYSFIGSTLKVRYRRSKLGFIWSAIIPLIQYSTLGVVFSWVFKITDERFTVYFMSGAVIFNYIGASLGGAPEVFLGNETFIKKIYVPKTVFAFQVVLLETVNLFFTFIPVLMLGLILGRIELNFNYIYLLYLLVCTTFMLIGASLVIGVVSVYFRDLRHIFPALILGLFYGTPILFPRTIVPEKFQFLVTYNPFFYFVEGFRAPIIDNQLPPLHYSAIILIFSFFLFVAGLCTVIFQGNKVVFKL